MEDKIKVKNAINYFYKGAGLKIKFTGSINPKVAETFGKMIIETQSCTTALSWVPRPAGGKATISWIAKNLTKSALSQIETKQSLTCAKTAILRYKTPLHLASLGL